MLLKIRGVKVIESLKSRAIHTKFVIKSSAIRRKKGAIHIILANLNGAIRHPKGASKGALC